MKSINMNNLDFIIHSSMASPDTVNIIKIVFDKNLIPNLNLIDYFKQLEKSIIEEVTNERYSEDYIAWVFYKIACTYERLDYLIYLDDIYKQSHWFKDPNSMCHDDLIEHLLKLKRYKTLYYLLKRSDRNICPTYRKFINNTYIAKHPFEELYVVLNDECKKSDSYGF